MLESLDETPWSELEHAYGPAADVPDLIRALRSTDATAREKALWELYGNIFHQGARYQASAPAAGFLLELAADPTTPGRPDILRLLTMLAIGDDGFWLPHRFPVESLRARAAGGDELLRAAPRSADPDDEDIHLFWESLTEQQRGQMAAATDLAAYDGVRAGTPLFCELLAAEDSRLRVEAAFALAWFGAEAAQTVGPLARAARDADASVAATAMVALGLIANDRPGVARDLDAFSADPRAVVRWGAAIAAASLLGEAAPEAATAELLAWTAGRSGSDPTIPFLDGDLAGHAGMALRLCGPGLEEKAFEALLAGIPNVDGPQALRIVGEALRRAFPDGRVAKGAEFAELDERQRHLVRALAASPATWG